MKGPVSVGISRPHVQLSQGTVVVGAIFGALILWLATNNKLVVYWAILTGKGGNTAGGYNPMQSNPSGGTTAPPGASSGGAGQTPGSDPTAPMVIPGDTTAPQPASLAPSSPIAIQSGAGPFTGGF